MLDPEVPLPHLIEHLFRDHYGRIVSGLTRIFGPERLDLAEDVAQEALLRAMKVWPFEGVPDRPEAWLIRAARNLALDAVRHRVVARRVEEELAQWAPPPAPPHAAAPDEVGDDRLRMIFTCCHPQLPPDSRVALTLKTLGGLGVAEIAAALLQKEATIAQRLSRAKANLQRHEVEFEVPAAHQLRPRLQSVLEVLYLMFNEGYRVHRGVELTRPDLIAEAIRLTGLLLEMPSTALPKTRALLALMLFLGARLPARTGAGGEPLTLALQDRSLWDREWINLAFHHFRQSIGDEEISRYHVEAAIASCHAAAPTYAETDWGRILDRYDHLLSLDSSPIVRLNRAVAVAKVRGADAALAELGALGAPKALRAYNLLPATKAQLLWVVGNHGAAAQSLREALAMECSEPERAFLSKRLAQCEAGEPAPAF